MASKGLLGWVQTFSSEVGSLEELHNGVVLGRIVNTITKDDTTVWDTNDNWLIKINNLKLLVRKVETFFILSLHLKIDLSGIDVSAIARSQSVDEIQKLVEAIVDMAVKCDDKQVYIEKMMSLDQEHQVELMGVIQKMDQGTMPATEADVQNAKNQDDHAGDDARGVSNNNSQARNDMMQEMEANIESLTQQVASLKAENTQMRDEQGGMNSQSLSRTAGRLQEENKRLKEEVVRLSKDSARQLGMSEDRINELQRKVSTMEARFAEESRTFEDNIRQLEDQIQLQNDELDMSRTKASQLNKMEVKLAKYQQKIEETVQLKQQMVDLEEQNSELLEKTLDQESSLSTIPTLKAQLETNKNRVVDLETEVSKLTAIAEARAKGERLRQHAQDRDYTSELEELRSENEDLKLQIAELETQPSNLGGDVLSHVGQATSPQLEKSRKMRQLEKENAHLKAKIAQFGDDATRDTYEQSLQEAQRRVEELELKALNSTGDEQVNSSVQEGLMEKLKVKESECNQLRLDKAKLEEYVRKALAATQKRFATSIQKLKTDLEQKCNENEAIKKQMDADKANQKREERLIVSAFYEVGLDIQRRVAKTGRETPVSSPGRPQSTSWLAKQRQRAQMG